MNQDNNFIPNLRFTEFSDNWKAVELRSVFSKKSDKNVNNKLSNVLTNSATKGVISQGDYFDKEIANNDNLSGYYIVDVDDFVYNPRISKSAPVGPLKRNNLKQGIISPLYTVLRKLQGNSKYLECYFDSDKWHRHMYKIANYGARHDRMSFLQGDFFNLIIPLPSPNEQLKISEFIFRITEWLQNLHEQKRLLIEYKYGLIQHLLSQKIRFKDEDGRNYSNWVEKRLGDLFSERNEKNGGKDLELLSVKIHGGVVPQGDTNKTDSSNSDKTNYKVVKVGDIAYNTMRMWQGASGVSQYEGIVSPAYTVVYPKKGDANFYGYLFKHPRTIFNFYRYSQGLTSDTWNLKFRHFSEIEVTVPSDIEEQKKIAAFLSSLDELIEHKEKQIALAEQWKKGLLQQMFV